MNGNSSYRLFANPRSPFARRIRLAVRRLNLSTTEEFVNVFEEQVALNAANPAGMIPTLITPEFGPLCDSNNILEYLHEKSGGIWPKEINSRIRVRQCSALTVGMIQASILYYQEVCMHEVPSPRWANDHVSIIKSSLAYITQTPIDNWIKSGELTQAGWDLAVALEYISFRMAFLNWEKEYPSLNELLALAQKDSFFKESKPAA